MQEQAHRAAVRADGARQFPDVDAEDGAPRGEDRRVLVEVGLAGVGALLGKDRRRHGGDREQHGEQARERHEPRTPPHRDSQPGRGEDETGEHDRGRRTDRAEQPHDDEARQRRTREVGEVEAADLIGLAAEQRGDDHADRDERREQGEAHDEQQDEVPDRRAVVLPDRQRVDPDQRDQEVAGSDADRSEHQRPQHDRVGARAPQAGRDRDDHATRADAEEREPDDQVRVVVEELERDDARVGDLEQQPGHADEEDLEPVRPVRFARADGRRRGGVLGVEYRHYKAPSLGAGIPGAAPPVPLVRTVTCRTSSATGRASGSGTRSSARASRPSSPTARANRGGRDRARCRRGSSRGAG